MQEFPRREFSRNLRISAPCREQLLSFEKHAWLQGFRRIAGIDEAGRGALCGPVVAAAVILPYDCYIPSVDDSKKLTPKKREIAFELIRNNAISIGIGLARADEIDRINILEASRLAMIRAINKIDPDPDFLLIDAVKLKQIDTDQLSIIKGDQKSHSIASASIIAKVIRDRIMSVWHRHFPEYQFQKNKGYGTASHLEKLNHHGPCPIHRITFNKVYNCKKLF